VAIGPALLTTTAVFICGFGVVAISEMPVLRIFSSLACVALFAALPGDLIILPALLVCLYRWRKR
jgi:predicted RND superfamily exporter protein